jgi:hypothetical protein
MMTMKKIYFASLFFLIMALSCSTETGQVKGIKPVMRIGTLAVMSFDSGNAGKDVGAAISEIVRTEIAAMKDIPYTVVERIMLNKVLMEQELSMTGLISKSDALKVGKILYADYLVMGRIIMFGDTYRISASIVETNTSIVKKQVIENVSSERDIPIASKSVSYKLFDKEFMGEGSSEKVPVSVEGIYASIYTDARGIHRGGQISLRVEGNIIHGYNIARIGKAEMYGTISGDFINGYYKAHYGYGNYSFRISEGGKYLIGTYYQVSNGENGDWIAVKGDTFYLPAQLFTGKWKVGDPCLVKWSGDGYWYPGRVSQVKDGLYFIRYDDGDSEWRFEKYIREERLKPGDVVFGRWRSGNRYYRGRITERKGSNIFIHYDDGDKEWTKISMVRVLIE